MINSYVRVCINAVDCGPHGVRNRDRCHVVDVLSRDIYIHMSTPKTEEEEEACGLLIGEGGRSAWEYRADDGIQRTTQARAVRMSSACLSSLPVLAQISPSHPHVSSAFRAALTFPHVGPIVRHPPTPLCAPPSSTSPSPIPLPPDGEERIRLAAAAVVGGGLSRYVHEPDGIG